MQLIIFQASSSTVVSWGLTKKEFCSSYVLPVCSPTIELHVCWSISLKSVSHNMALSYHSKVSSIKKKKYHFSLVWVMEFSIIPSCFLHVWVKSKFFSHWAILVKVQLLYEKFKWNTFASNGVYTFFINFILLLHNALLNCFIHSRVRAS